MRKYIGALIVLLALVVAAGVRQREVVPPCTTDSDCVARFGGDGSPRGHR